MTALNHTTPLTIGTGTGSGIALGTSSNGFRKYDWFQLDAKLVNTDTSATLDVYIQRQITAPLGTGSTTMWLDWAHFPQLAASAGVKTYSATVQSSNGFTAVGTGSSPALAANTFIGGHPGDKLRLVTSKSVVGDAIDQTQTVYVTGWAERR